MTLNSASFRGAVREDLDHPCPACGGHVRHATNCVITGGTYDQRERTMQTVASKFPQEKESSVKIQMDIFTPSMTPEFLMYLGWWDLRATQEKLIREKKAFLQRWYELYEKIERLIQDREFPNQFYALGLEDALLAAHRKPQELIPPLHEYAITVPWRVPNLSRQDQPPSTDQCTVCKKESTTFLYVEEGPAFNAILCSEACLQQQLRYYVEEDNMIRAFVHGMVERPLFTLDKPVKVLLPILQTLPSRSNLRKPAQETKGMNFDFVPE